MEIKWLIFYAIKSYKSGSNLTYQKQVYKIKLETDLRKYKAPARGSEKWKEIYKQRTSVERVNSYLKEYFQLNNVRYRTGKRAKVHFNLVTLIYNCTKLAVDRIKQKLNQRMKIAA